MPAPADRPRRLFVLRHAKSSWSNAQLADHDRPLAPRGRRAAEALAAHVATIDPPPALVLCSTARRAQDTLEPVRSRLPDSTEVLIEDDLYGAPAPLILARLRRIPDTTPSVLVVGHNPGLDDLVRSLGRDGDPGLIARVHAKFPTGALVTLETDAAWADMGPECATIVRLVLPRELG